PARAPVFRDGKDRPERIPEVPRAADADRRHGASRRLHDQERELREIPIRHSARHCGGIDHLPLPDREELPRRDHVGTRPVHDPRQRGDLAEGRAHRVGTDFRSRLTPQMLKYDAKFSDSGEIRWRPYVMYFHPASHRSDVVNTDSLGFRYATTYDGRQIAVENSGDYDVVNVLAGSSTVFGIGATSDAAT